MQWSQFQQNIFDFVTNKCGNAIIRAVAGSGKSTTIVQAMRLVPETIGTVFLAFNKAIADELKGRGVNGKTFHSLCAPAAFRHTGASSVTNDKTSKLMYKHYPEEVAYKYASFVSRLVSLGKQTGIGCLQPNEYRVWDAIVDHHYLEIDAEGATIEQGIEYAMEVLELGNRSDMMDFDDMLYLPVMFGLKLPTFGFVFVDEAQDTNGIQREILRKIMGPRSRLIAVGDPAQAIYGFRGSDSRSLALIGKEFNCVDLPLSVTYRCAKSIVGYARQWVDHITPREGAPVGEVINLGTNYAPTDFTSDDLVVCRTTAPLMALAFSMLRERVPVTVMGRAIGDGLIRLIKKQRAVNLDVLEDRLTLWSTQETNRAVAKGDEAKCAAIDDKFQCILTLINSVREEHGNVHTLTSIIAELFAPTRNSTTLATIHKSKGWKLILFIGLITMNALAIGLEKDGKNSKKRTCAMLPLRVPRTSFA